MLFEVDFPEETDHTSQKNVRSPPQALRKMKFKNDHTKTDLKVEFKRHLTELTVKVVGNKFPRFKLKSSPGVFQPLPNVKSPKKGKR